MRILVYFDAPHQRKYLAVIEDAFDGDQDVVLAAGPGPTDRYFGLAGGSSDVAATVARRPPPGGLRTLSSIARLVRRAGRRALRRVLHLQRVLRRRLAQVVNRMLRAGYRRHLPHAGRLGVRGWWSRACLLGCELLTASAQLWTSGRQQLGWLADAKRLLRRAAPDVVVLLEDNVQGLTGAVGAAATKLRIPYVVLPDFIPNPLEPATFFQDDPVHRADLPLGSLVARTSPKWSYSFDGRPLLRLPVASIIVKAATRQRCPQPWVLNAGFAEAILLESEASRAHYLDLGFAPTKLQVVGSAVEDQIHRRWIDRDRLLADLTTRLGLAPDKMLIVCAFPPDQFDTPSGAFEHASFAEMAAGWFDAFADVGAQANVVVCPHPRTDPARLRPYESPTIRVVGDETVGVVALADLFVACVSSTIRWALALGIPVIDYDCYRYGYGDFRTAAGVVQVTAEGDFRAALARYADPAGIADLKELAQRDGARWGRSDGQFAHRLREVLAAAHDRYDHPSATHGANG